MKPWLVYLTFVAALWAGIAWWQSPRTNNLLTSNVVKQIQRYDSARQTDFKNLWKRIDNLLANQQPATPAGPSIPDLIGLRKPADPSAIETLEQNLGYKIPGDLKASLLVHNGSDSGFLSNYQLLSAEKILASWSLHLYVEAADGVVIDSTPENCSLFWHPGWIPVAGPDPALIVINLENGKVYRFNEPGLSLIADSWKQWLTTAADRLERGNFQLRHDPKYPNIFSWEPKNGIYDPGSSRAPL